MTVSMRSSEGRFPQTLRQTGTAGPAKASERLDVLDALRGFALFGIFVINLRSFSGWNAMSSEARAVFATPLDRATLFMHDVLLHGKFYTLFSLLFGIGFAIQLTRGAAGAGPADDVFMSRYRRRLWVLLGFGLVHMTFLWDGDILTLYALCGFVLLLFRDLADRTLLRWATVLVLLPVPWYALMLSSGGAFNPGGALTAMGDAAWARFGYTDADSLEVLARGGWMDMFYWNIVGPLYRFGGLVFEGRFFKVLGIFLVGFWAGRRLMAGGLLDDRRLLRRVLIVGLAVGLPLNMIFGWLLATGIGSATLSPLGLLHAVVYALGVAPLGLAFAAGFALLWQRRAGRRALGVFAPAGRVALTTYLSQTLIGLSFYGIGFGIAGKLGPAAWTSLAVLIFTGQVVLATVWLRYFRFGPAEWLWRRLTYRMPLEFRRRVVSA